MTIGRLPIGEIEIPTKKRSGALPGLCDALKEMNQVIIEFGHEVFKKRGGSILLKDR